MNTKKANGGGVQLYTWLPSSTLVWLKASAAAEHRAMSNLVWHIIEAYLRQHHAALEPKDGKHGR
jgi:hypothetical protein